MGVKTLVCGLFLLLCIGIAIAFPLQPYTLYGKVTVDGNVLTKDDSNIITLVVDGEKLVTFQMGESNADAYVLLVHLDSEEIEGATSTGATARIFVDGNEVDQSPVIIGDIGITYMLDLTIGGDEEPDPEPDTERRSSGGGGSGSSSRDPIVDRETIVIPEPEAKEPVQPQQISEPEPSSEVIVTPIAAREEEMIDYEERQSFFQRLVDLFRRSPTGDVVADVPQAKPLIGIIIILVIVVIGLTIAYFLIFSQK